MFSLLNCKKNSNLLLDFVGYPLIKEDKPFLSLLIHVLINIFQSTTAF